MLISKKKIRKFVSFLFPKSQLKERIKCFWYNLFSDIDVSFEILSGYYKTVIKGVEVLSYNPLYKIVFDFKNYQHFFKVKKGDYVLDAGANVGNLTCYFSKLVEKNGKVLAFEPDSYNLSTLQKNLNLNLVADNVLYYDYLLWNNDKKVEFYEAGNVASSAHWIPDQEKLVYKQAITIDSWMEKHNIPKIDFIKMDIEGAEIEALEGCIETIKKYQPNFAIASYHIVNEKPTYLFVEEFFYKLNYPFKTVKFNKTEIITFAGSSINS